MTELAGTRYHEQSAQVGEEVELVLEPTNPKDPQAVAATVVRGGSPYCVGYAMRGLHLQFHRWLGREKVSARVARLNGTKERPLVYVHVWVGGAK